MKRREEEKVSVLQSGFWAANESQDSAFGRDSSRGEATGTRGSPGCLHRLRRGSSGVRTVCPLMRCSVASTSDCGKGVGWQSQREQHSALGAGVRREFSSGRIAEAVRSARAVTSKGSRRTRLAREHAPSRPNPELRVAGVSPVPVGCASQRDFLLDFLGERQRPRRSGSRPRTTT